MQHQVDEEWKCLCRKNRVQPEILSPSAPTGQAHGFIHSRKHYFATDLHIDSKLFSPCSADTLPPLQALPTLDGLSYDLDALCTKYSEFFNEVLGNVITLPKNQYHKLRSSFRSLPYTGVHLSSSQDDIYDRLRDTPLFAPLCTALLRKVVWFLYSHDADDFSHKLRVYEKELAAFVRQFLLACHEEGVAAPTEGVAAPTEGVSLDEEVCDLHLSDPTHLLARVLALQPYYVGYLCVDESLFTTLQREGSLLGEGVEEVRWEQLAVFSC